MKNHHIISKTLINGIHGVGRSFYESARHMEKLAESKKETGAWSKSDADHLLVVIPKHIGGIAGMFGGGFGGAAVTGGNIVVGVAGAVIGVGIGHKVGEGAALHSIHAFRSVAGPLIGGASKSVVTWAEKHGASTSSPKFGD